MKRLAITGGAGYIGRCTADALIASGYEPIILDNFSTGWQSIIGNLNYHEVDLSDTSATRSLFSKIGPLDGIIHFAAKALVGESVEQPDVYFHNNVMATVNVAQAAVENGIANLVHSSSCAVYGVPAQLPMTEDTPLAPVSPYGESKRMAEQVLAQYVVHRKLKVLNLRYFNPAGSFKEGSFGESHDPETHLVPNVINAYLNKKPFLVFGSDYPTADGTCVRDLIHIEDLVKAHLLGLDYLDKQKGPFELALNLGAGKGISVKEVIRAFEGVVGEPIEVVEKPRRQGDPPELYADISKAKSILKWEPRKTLAQMLSDHLAWMKGRGKEVLS